MKTRIRSRFARFVIVGLASAALIAPAAQAEEFNQPGPGTGIEQSSSRVTLDGRPMPVEVVIVPAEVIAPTEPGIGVGAPVPETAVSPDAAPATPVADDSTGFSWTNALIGGAIGLAIGALVVGAIALAIRRRDHLAHA